MTPPFSRVLIANRGEIAVRVARGLRELGIEVVAVHSDPDAGAPHVLAADRAVPLGGAAATDSYLDIDQVVAAARDTGCEAVHPGYGFLSENPVFAKAVADAGMVFIGPEPHAMERLGSKQQAREVAKAAGVPVVPGIDNAVGTDEELLARAEEIGYPVMVKASAGGGGKGMRRVASPADFVEALHASRREAKSAFGDDRMILEKVVFPARHIEIQMMGDHHGNVVSFHERECSVQRRHQKVLEEAPSPAVDPDLRQAMGDAAVRLAKAIGYRNAGTVEFLLGPDGSFYFLEVNTRLQVEHPVTEMVTGVDLVHLQVQVAAGGDLSELLRGKDLTPRGHSIEARIYAEVPEEGYLPAVGTVVVARDPEGPGVRVDSGVVSGSEVTVHYDPMLAKLIVHAPDRDAACTRLVRALRDSVWLGLRTNVDFLTRVVEHEGFRSGDLRTDFLDLHPELTKGPARDVPTEAFVAAAVCGLLAPAGEGERATAGVGGGGGLAPTPWQTLAGLRVWGGGA